MAQRLVDRPVWVSGALSGALFGVFMALYGLTQDHRVWLAVVTGVLGGIFFGVVMGGFFGRVRRRQEGMLGDIPVERRATATKADFKGPVPVDPELRAEALRVAEFQLAEMQRTRDRNRRITLALVLLGGWLALTQSPWFWLTAAFFGAQGVVNLLLPARYRRRISALRAGLPSGFGAASAGPAAVGELPDVERQDQQADHDRDRVEPPAS